MPLVFGILISVTITSKMALSSFFFASSPELTVSTLCPSRRKAISSIWQIERSSSQTRMLPMDSFSYGGTLVCGCCQGRVIDAAWGGDFRAHATQPKNKHATLPHLGSGPNFAFVRLHNLIHDGQAQPGATFKVRLERLKYLFHSLRGHAGASVGKINLPIFAHRLHRDRQGSTIAHGAHGVLAKIPEDLLDLVAISEGHRFRHDQLAHDVNTQILRCQTILHAQIAFQTPDLGQVIQHIDMPNRAAVGNREWCGSYAESIAKAIGRYESNFAVRRLGTRAGQRVKEQFLNRLSPEFTV